MCGVVVPACLHAIIILKAAVLWGTDAHSSQESGNPLKGASAQLILAWPLNGNSMCGVVVQAAKMLHYLGDHILMLTSMNLRDYLRLKVEIQGTSGEGSKAVKAFRSAPYAVWLCPCVGSWHTKTIVVDKCYSVATFGLSYCGV